MKPKNLLNQVYNQTCIQVWTQIHNQVDNPILNQVYNQTCIQVWTQIWNQVSAQVYNQVRYQVNEEFESE